jgi:tRNA A37 threonylcarbamoyladenosine dehydratase
MSFKRLLPLVGIEGLNALKNARILVVGVGGVGSYTVSALARSGIGHLIMVDPDIIEECNINRQLLAFTSSIGDDKVAWLEHHVKDINPEIKVTALKMRYDESTSDVIFAHQPTHVIDCIDETKVKIHLVEKALDKELPILSVLAQGNRLKPGGMLHTTLKKTTYDPIAKKMRSALKNHPSYHAIEVIWNQNPSEIEVPGIGCVASSAVVPAEAGLMAAGVMVEKIVRS